MSLLHKIELDRDNILITMKMTRKEFEVMAPSTKEFIVFPATELDKIFTTGKLGNGNRIMVPNRFLKSHGIEVLRKNVPGRMLDLGESKFLIIELESKKIGIPQFKEE